MFVNKRHVFTITMTCENTNACSFNWQIHAPCSIPYKKKTFFTVFTWFQCHKGYMMWELKYFIIWNFKRTKEAYSFAWHYQIFYECICRNVFFFSFSILLFCFCIFCILFVSLLSHRGMALFGAWQKKNHLWPSFIFWIWTKKKKNISDDLTFAKTVIGKSFIDFDLSYILFYWQTYGC